MQTLDIIVKDYDTNIVLRNCQMQYFEYYFEKEGTPFHYLPVILLNLLPTICLWSSVLGLLLIHEQRLRRARIDNSVWEIGYVSYD